MVVPSPILSKKVTVWQKETAILMFGIHPTPVRLEFWSFCRSDQQGKLPYFFFSRSDLRSGIADGAKGYKKCEDGSHMN